MDTNYQSLRKRVSIVYKCIFNRYVIYR